MRVSIYRIAGNFRWVLIFAISGTVYGVAKIKTAIIYSNRNSKGRSFEIAKITIARIISHTFTSMKISRYTVILTRKILMPTLFWRLSNTSRINMKIKSLWIKGVLQYPFSGLLMFWIFFVIFYILDECWFKCLVLQYLLLYCFVSITVFLIICDTFSYPSICLKVILYC